jgi:hypothetical protein
MKKLNFWTIFAAGLLAATTFVVVLQPIVEQLTIAPVV